MRSAGCDIEVHLYPGTAHSFLCAVAPEGAPFLEREGCGVCFLKGWEAEGTEDSGGTPSPSCLTQHASPATLALLHPTPRQCKGNTKTVQGERGLLLMPDQVCLLSLPCMLRHHPTGWGYGMPPKEQMELAWTRIVGFLKKHLPQPA